jgi:hypothetical protein
VGGRLGPPASANPRVPGLLLGIWIGESAVLAGVAVLLFFAPSAARGRWPWDLLPFNARFLGAVYVASFAAILSLVLVGRWSPARLVAPMILTFTAIVLVVSLVYLDRFQWGRPATAGWFFLYVIVPANAAYYLWLVRDWPPVDLWRPPTAIRRALLAAAGVAGGYGIALLVAPGTTGGFWPWPLDAFQGRLYSAIFVTVAVGIVIVARAAASIELATLGGTLLALGGFAVAGVLVVDADVHKVDWSSGGTWAWIVIFAAVAACGAAAAACALARASSPAPVTAPR